MKITRKDLRRLIKEELKKATGSHLEITAGGYGTGDHLGLVDGIDSLLGEESVEMSDRLKAFFQWVLADIVHTLAAEVEDMAAAGAPFRAGVDVVVRDLKKARFKLRGADPAGSVDFHSDELERHYDDVKDFLWDNVRFRAEWKKMEMEAELGGGNIGFYFNRKKVGRKAYMKDPSWKRYKGRFDGIE